MKNLNIERNKLDYILTDLLPVEISELFSLTSFYDYLLKNKIVLNGVVSKMQQFVADNKGIPFKNGWATAPLKFNILKGHSGHREISLLQPVSILNVYLFLECYQKEILLLLKENSVYSLRYHSKNSDLYYKKRVNKISEYFQPTAKKISKGILQQTGAYFKIRQFNSVSSFTGSQKWQQLNFKYSNFARMDYKSCFDSIYTHTYKWINQKNVVDSKGAENANLYITIDRVLQNINAKSSNGVVVGPEFSRMIVEILLQKIDMEVLISLSCQGLEKSKDYNIYRYVDDIFIFASSESYLDKIILTVTEVAQKYLLHPNELKLQKAKTPFTLNNWLSKTRELADRIASLFYNTRELKNSEDNNKHLIKGEYMAIDKIKNEFNALVCDFPDQQRTIVSFSLSTLLNNISKKKNGVRLFKEGSENQAFRILELAFYIMVFCPCFEHVQRFISMIVYVNDELMFVDNPTYHQKLQNLFTQYSFVFLRGNLNDLCNLFLLCSEFNIYLPLTDEKHVFKTIKQQNNPLLLANFLLYSKYYKPYFDEILIEIEDIIERNISHITKGEELLQREFWFILIFNNCPFISARLKQKTQDIIDRIRVPNADKPSGVIINLFCDFLSSNKKNLFFTWGAHQFSVSKQIAFRTHQRTIFREYKRKNSLLLYTSID